MGDDNLEKNRSLEHATMQLCNLGNLGNLILSLLMKIMQLMQLMQQDFDDILTWYWAY